MGRTIIADNNVQKTTENICDPKNWTVGVVIGQLTQQRDFAVHIVKTPPVEDPNGEDENDQGKKKSPASLDAMEDTWVAAHAKQVLRMLPGGLDVIGIFAAGPPDTMKSAQMKLKQMLFAVQKKLSKGQARMNEEITDRYVIQICSVTKKITCRTCDVADPKSGLNPADWKYQTHLDKWLQLNSSLSIDLNFAIPNEKMSQTLLKHIQTGLQPLCDNISNGLLTIDGCIPTDSNPLDTSAPPSSGKGKKNKETAATSRKPYNVQFYTQLAYQPCTSTPSVTECGSKIVVEGTVVGRAFVHNKATIKEAKQAIRQDIVRMLLSRCELLCEDLLQAEEDQELKVLYETPIRVFSKSDNTPVSYCDYMFQDETAKDSLERFKELLDLSLTEDQLECDCERVPSEEDLYCPTKKSSKFELPPTDDETPDVEKTATNIVGILFGGLVAALAAGISYMYLE